MCIRDRIYIISNTKKALQFTYKDKNVQLIHFKYFNSPEEIFETFDYTVCMGAFDFKTEEFILHRDFLKHNSQRILKFNPSTAFPIVSMLRVQKYEGKKYSISKPEFIRVILTCMNLEINTYEELKDQLGGMYGVNYDKLFEDIKDEEFSLEAAIDKIAGIALSEDYFKAPIHVEFNDVEDILDSITKQPIPYMILNDVPHRAFKYWIKPIDNIPANGKEISPEDYFKDMKIYKFVQPDLSSFHDRFFIYSVGEVAIAKGRKYGLSDPGLFFSTKNVTTSTYYHQKNKVLLEAEFNPLDVLEYDQSEVIVKKAKITRIVPEEEWTEWVKGEEEDDLF